MPHQARSGWGLRDVIVVIIVLNLAVILGLPAIEYAREAARKHSCANNLSRLGMALHAYHDQYACLPPAAVWSSDGLNLPRFLKEPRPVTVIHTNWAIMLLPFIGEDDLARQFAAGQSIADITNEQSRLVELGEFTCPSDTFHTKANRYVEVLPSGEQVEFARGNYGINGGSHHFMVTPGWLSEPRINGCQFAFDEQSRTFQWWGDGVAGINKSLSFDEFENGRSTLAMVDELRAGVAPVDSRGVWALGQIGSSITWAHGVNGDAFGPNATHVDADDVAGCIELHRQVGRDFLVAEGMTCCDHCDKSEQATSRSKHENGVNILMADGAVRFVSNAVSPSLWQVMHSRDTPAEVIDLQDNPHLDRERFKERLTAPPVVVQSTVDLPARPAAVLTNSIGMSFTFLPAGEFTMGVPDRGNIWPYPDKVAVEHRVAISRGFYCGTHEISQAQFQRVMGYNPSWHGNLELAEPDTTAHRNPELPVDNVSWYEADEFCQRLSALPDEQAAKRIFRLPTEAEWEYACRSGNSAPHPYQAEWDNDAYETGVIAGKSWTETPLPVMPIGSFPPNEFGLYDMRGNLFEWTNDWFALDYYLWSPSQDPRGPADGYLKCVRGWDWRFTGPHCKNDYLASAPWKQSRYLGFRVICDIVQ